MVLELASEEGWLLKGWELEREVPLLEAEEVRESYPWSSTRDLRRRRSSRKLPSRTRSLSTLLSKSYPRTPPSQQPTLNSKQVHQDQSSTSSTTLKSLNLQLQPPPQPSNPPPSSATNPPLPPLLTPPLLLHHHHQSPQPELVDPNPPNSLLLPLPLPTQPPNSTIQQPSLSSQLSPRPIDGFDQAQLRLPNPSQSRMDIRNRRRERDLRGTLLLVWEEQEELLDRWNLRLR